MHWRLFLTTLIICLGSSLHFGIQLTVLNPTEAVFHNFINSTHHLHYGSYLTDGTYRVLWSVILNLTYVGTFVGSLAVVSLSERLGRLRTFYVSAGVIVGGLLCQILAKVASAYELLAIGRLCVGIGCGVALPLQMMYLHEISPVDLRGSIGGVSGMFVVLGYTLGGVLALPVVLGTDSHWLFMFLVEAVPAFLLLPVLPILHESPSYLVSKDRLDAAKKSLDFFGHKDVDSSIKEIQTELEAQKNGIEWRDLWEKVHLRQAVFLSMALAMATLLSGMVVVDFFSTSILAELGLSLEIAQYASIGIFAGTLIASIFSGFIIDRIGRKFLLLSTTLALIIINTSFMVFSIIHLKYEVKWAGVASIAACCALTLAFGLGLSVLVWIVPSELVPQNARSRVNFLAMLVYNVGSGITGFIFYPLEGVVGPYVFLVFIIPLILFFIIFFWKLPETKCKTSLEVMRKLGFEEDTKL